MQHRITKAVPRAIAQAAAVLLVCLTALPALAGTVKHRLSSQTSWVGSPITLDLIFENVASHEPPVLPTASGLLVSSGGPPSHSSRVSIINGHHSEQSALTYHFLIDVDEPGTYVLPGFQLSADARTYETEPIQLTFRSANDPALIRAQVTGIPSQAWVGDTLPATIRILVKPFRDRQLPEEALSAVAMWRQIDFESSRWGPFLDPIVEMLKANRFPAMTLTEVDVDGLPERWYAYDITSDIRLRSEGPLDLSDVLVRMNYPVQLGRNSGSFFDPLPSLGVAAARPVEATPGIVQVDVQTPPTSGRPATWSGAIGQYRFDVSASPTEVVVGEPITLTMRITDVGSGPSDLELLQAPALSHDEALTESFRVPDDRPGGVVSGRTKTFTQSIRPVSAEVDFIPPIPLAYFDPLTRKYDIAFSRPIDIQVTSSLQLDAATLGGPQHSGPRELDEVTSVRGGLLANYTDPDTLLATQRRPGAGWLAGIMVTPPIAVGLLAGLRSRRASDERNPKRRRCRIARRRFNSRMVEAGNEPDAAAQAVRSFVADRLGLPEDAITSGEAADAVRQAGHGELATRLRRQLADLERMGYAGNAGGGQEPPIQAIRDLVHELEATLR
ncbi:MAG: BatD family protein [Phycisphaerales bacterium]|nr:BatD family protein [Phycisphaerales bacterium]